MPQLLREDFADKWIPLLADNVFMNIDGPLLERLIVDIKDSFAASTLTANVPDWVKDTYYPQGYVILHQFVLGPAIFLKANQEGYLDEPTAVGGDVNWSPALSPAPDNALYQVGTVEAMRRAYVNWKTGRLYVLVGRVDPATGEALPDVYVRALSATQLEPEAWLFDESASGAEPVRVRYDLDTDSTEFLDVSYPNAPALVCVRADGTENYTHTTLEAACEWTNGGGAGSITYVNRPQQLNDFVTLEAGTILDVQHWPIDLNDWPIRMGPGTEIRNNRLLYGGRISPFLPDADPAKNFFTVFGGKVAGRINFQSSAATTVILDAVEMVDFGQSQIPTITGGPATSPEPTGKVVLRNGAHFTAGYQPHPNTTVTVEAESGAITDAQAVAAVAAALVAANPRHTGLVVKIVNSEIVLEVKATNVSDIVFDTVALGAGNLVTGHFNMTSSLTGYYELKSAQNISSIQIFRIDANANDFNGSPASWPKAGVYLQASLSGYTLTITPLNVNAPTSLLLRLL